MMNISGCKICPPGMEEEYREGKENYKDFRRYPHIACVTKKPVPKETVESSSIVAFSEFGGVVREKIQSAQAYFSFPVIGKDKKPTGDVVAVRHYQLRESLGDSRPNDKTSFSYEFKPGAMKKFGTVTVKPGPGSIIKVRASSRDKGAYSYVEIDPSAFNVYCQPLVDLVLTVDDEGMLKTSGDFQDTSHSSSNVSCIGGNIKQLSMKKAKEKGLETRTERHDVYKEWIDMKSTETRVENRDELVDWFDRFVRKTRTG